VFTRACVCTQSLASWVQSTSLHPISLRPFKYYAPEMSPPVAKGTNQSPQVKVVSAPVHVTTDSYWQYRATELSLLLSHSLFTSAKTRLLNPAEDFCSHWSFLMKIHNYLRLSQQFVVVDHLRKSDFLVQNTLDPNRHRATERQITMGTTQNRWNCGSVA